MSERSSVYETVKLGVESLAAPGVVVPASKQLESLGLRIKPKHETSRFRPNGFKYDSQIVPGKDWTEYSLMGRLDYVNILYPLASLLNAYPTIASSGTNIKDWSFISRTDSPDPRQTFSIDSGSFYRGQRTVYTAIPEFGITFKRESAEIDGSAIGQQMQDPVYPTGNAVYTVSFTGTVTGGTFTLTYSGQTTTALAWNATNAAVQQALFNLSSIGPGNVYVTGGPGPAAYVIQFVAALGNQVIVAPTGTFTALTGTTPGGAITTTQAGSVVTTVAAVPVNPGNVSIYADATAAGLGVTKLLRVLQATLKIGDRFNPLWVVNGSNGSWAALVDKAPNVTLQLKMVADGAAMAYLTELRNGNNNSQFFRIEANGPTLPAPDAASNYRFRWDMATKVETSPSRDETDGAETVDWTFRAVGAPTWSNQAIIASIRNVTASL